MTRIRKSSLGPLPREMLPALQKQKPEIQPPKNHHPKPWHSITEQSNASEVKANRSKKIPKRGQMEKIY